MTTEQSTAETEQTTAATATDGATVKISAEEKKQQIVNAFKSKLDRGETTLESIAEAQPWVAELLQKPSEPDVTPELIKKSVKEELREELKIESQWDAAFASASPKEAKELADIREKYESSLGAAKTLELALQLTGVDTSREARLRKNLRIRDIGDDINDVEDIKVTNADREFASQLPYPIDPKKVAERRRILENGGSLILN